jgi:uncharacterized protein (DUF2267 family)
VKEIVSVRKIEFEDFIDRVARRAGLKQHEALRAGEAVLEALAARLSGDRVDGIAPRLPAAFGPPLKRGKARSKGAAGPLPVDDFLGAVAELARTTPEDARDHAQAVLATLWEAIGEQEFAELAARLQDAYASLLVRR